MQLSNQTSIIILFCWLAAWGQSYKGKAGQPNHFNVITHSQQQLSTP